ncbi:MAG: ABC transporter ATP-binding protein [Cyanobacteria bacterium P01_A01_bin.123]
MLNPASTVSSPLLRLGTHALAVEELCFAYPDGLQVLQAVEFEIQWGERVGLIGPNGAGKTTLFMLLCGLLTPNQGEIRLFERAVVPGEFRSEIGLVFQNPADQLFSLSVRDDVAFGPINMGLSADEIERRVQAALYLTGMVEFADRPPHHLSGGQKRMVAIASVLAMHPQLIIYDEPSANLDIRARRRLIQFLQHAEQTTLVCSHDLDLILDVCDRVLLIDQGQIIADGPTREIMGNGSLMEAHGLECPYALSNH